MDDQLTGNATKFCKDCGEKINAKAEICPKCGVRQEQPKPINGKSKTVAGLFGIFLGGLGVHKFYLGEPGWGVLHILFCWTFIPAIVGFIQGIMYFGMSDEAFAAKYGNTGN